MQHNDLLIFGVDVAKAELVAVSADRGSRSLALPNQATAIQDWLATLARGSVVAMEATGKYHRLLAELAHAAGMRVYVLNARDVHFYAKALGARGKTDRVDAGVIARYVSQHHSQLHAWEPAQGPQRLVQELVQRRARVTEMRVSLRQTLDDVPLLAAAGQPLLEQFERFIRELDGKLEELLRSDPVLRCGAQRLRTLTGLGLQGSAYLAALFSRLRFANADAVVAYGGLDPRAEDSGTRHGKRKLSKRGPALLRRQMYLAAFSACHSKAFGDWYASMRARGYASTPTLVILARKLLRIAWSMWNSEQSFDAQRLQRPAGA